MTDRKTFEKSLLNTYSTWHDVFPQDGGDTIPLIAKAEFRSRNEKYVLVKQAKLWSAENYEYSYIFSAEKLTTSMVSECIDFALADGMPKIKPHSEHMCSYITVIILADQIENDAIQKVRKSRYTKNFHFSLHGWMALKVLAKDMGDGFLYTNREGRDLIELFKNVQKACDKKQATSQTIDK